MENSVTGSDPERSETGSAAQSDREGAGEAALPVGTRLSDEFEIVGLVGQGGFGIVYLAQDHALQRRVAVKEYMPASLATRGADRSVVLRSERHAETFQVGLRSFVNEARLLAQFDHPALLKVYRFWEANGTAYMAMPYYEGLTLKDWLRQQPSPPDEAWLRRLLMPVLDALELLHRENCFHRDIAPDNIMLLADGRPVLLDFGAARRVIGDMTQALTVILKPGYAPVEQYAETPGIRQGPWTDIYALGALVYFTITGHTPPPSVGRMIDDRYQPLARIAAGRYSDAFLRTIDRCLAVRSEQRPQSVAELRELLLSGASAQLPAESVPSDATVIIAPEQVHAALAAADAAPAPEPVAAAAPSSLPAAAAVATALDSGSGGSSIRRLALVGGAIVLAGAAALWWYMQGDGGHQQAEVAGTTAPATAPKTEEPIAPALRTQREPPALQPAQPAAIGLSIATRDGSLRFRPDQAISIRVQADRSAYLYCFMQDEKGAIQRFFPNRFRSGARVGIEGIELPGRMKFRISANFRGSPEAILCAASPVELKGLPLIAAGDFKPLEVAGLDDLGTRLARAAGPETGIAKLELLQL